MYSWYLIEYKCPRHNTPETLRVKIVKRDTFSPDEINPYNEGNGTPKCFHVGKNVSEKYIRNYLIDFYTSRFSTNIILRRLV